MGTQTMSVSLNTDSAGFISQECPTCERRFKIQPGKGSPNPVSHCPFCEHSATDCWFTPQQAEYLGAVAAHEVLGPQLEDLERAFRRLGSGSGGMIRVTGRVEKPRVPPTPEENDDEMLTMTAFACCGETIRHDAANAPIYCIICGNGTRLAAPRFEGASAMADKKTVTIIVDGTPHVVDKDKVTYAEIVTLAYPDYPQHPEITYSVTYKRGPNENHEGTLAPGGSVMVKDGMVFNVSRTGQS